LRSGFLDDKTAKKLQSEYKRLVSGYKPGKPNAIGFDEAANIMANAMGPGMGFGAPLPHKQPDDWSDLNE